MRITKVFLLVLLAGALVVSATSLRAGVTIVDNEQNAGSIEQAEGTVQGSDPAGKGTTDGLAGANASPTGLNQGGVKHPDGQILSPPATSDDFPHQDVSSVPEPSTLILFLAGLAGGGMLARRKAKKS